MSPVTCLFFLVLLLNQRRSPPLRLQASHCSTFRIMCDVPSIAVFCSESIECFPGTASKFFLKLLVPIPVAPVFTGIIVHFRFHIRFISIHKLLLLLLLLLLLSVFPSPAYCHRKHRTSLQSVGNNVHATEISRDLVYFFTTAVLLHLTWPENVTYIYTDYHTYGGCKHKCAYNRQIFVPKYYKFV